MRHTSDEKWAEKLEGLDLTVERDEKWAERLEGLCSTVVCDEKWAEGLEGLGLTVESKVECKKVGKGPQVSRTAIESLRNPTYVCVHLRSTWDIPGS